NTEIEALNTGQEATDTDIFSVQQAAASIIIQNEKSQILTDANKSGVVVPNPLISVEAEGLAVTPLATEDETAFLVEHSIANSLRLSSTASNQTTLQGEQLTQADQAVTLGLGKEDATGIATISSEILSKSLQNQEKQTVAGQVQPTDLTTAHQAGASTDDGLIAAPQESEMLDIPEHLSGAKLELTSDKARSPLAPRLTESDRLTMQYGHRQGEHNQRPSEPVVDAESTVALESSKQNELISQLRVKSDTQASKFSRPGSAEVSEVLFEELVAQQSNSDSKNPNIGHELSNSPSSYSNLGGARANIPVNIHFSKPEWSNMVADRTALMFAQNVTSADLQLDPPELGPLQVKVSVNQDQASVVFMVSNAAVRDSLDQSVLRLKELLAQQGLDLVNVDVSDRQQSSSQQHSGEEPAQRGIDHSNEEERELGDNEQREIILNYGIDSYV
nr:flagellar hook-length control protein FliK [Cellvibrionaceae bacterium]